MHGRIYCFSDGIPEASGDFLTYTTRHEHTWCYLSFLGFKVFRLFAQVYLPTYKSKQ